MSEHSLKRERSDDGADEERASKKAKLDVDVDGPPEQDEHETPLPLDPLGNPEVNIDPETGLKVFLGPAIRIRDGAPKAEERQGILRWKCVRNTGQPEDLRLLVDLKDVIARQLPNMPKDYITRLVLDINHASVIGLRNNKVIGGITFKCFQRPNMVKFIEIVFCAIKSEQQVKGYGSRLMSHMKKWAQENTFLHLLTYADDYAIGYFQRQGFTLELELDRRHWDIGFLKHYDSATLMHCQIDPKVDYLEISEQLHIQRMAFIGKIRELTTQHLIYPGVTDFKKNADPDSKVIPLDLEKLPGLHEAGWSPDNFKRLISKESQEKIFKENEELLNRILKEEALIWPFKAPVQELFPSEASKYLEAVKDPIDLKTIEKNLKRGFYITHEMLVADLLRMVENCKSYNPKDSVYYTLADQIHEKFLTKEVTEVHVPTSPPK